MYKFILIIHILISFILIFLVLFQNSKGSSMNFSFNSSISSTLFGSKGLNSFLYKLTTVLSLFFFITSISLSYCLSVKLKNLTLVNHNKNYAGDMFGENVLVPSSVYKIKNTFY
ncbi:preprotein translocase subunit SecG [Candidatus Legionella polyplacis]|uniref:preprotein translocase subunit SecG n=1 Tax=Candidatus Legionella polyplacis TaxID=2005262 RepID=UPI000C1F6FBA|nr:preprotein translocase subunit SecG [Candidatus Legionella polyplacis]ATW01809.1 preprotein translocase subunit SecG [Candidatus Legionella polyplacis]